jgi:chromosome segregation ATPase
LTSLIDQITKYQEHISQTSGKLTACQSQLINMGVNQTLQIQVDLQRAEADLREVERGISLVVEQEKLIGEKSELSQQQVSLAALEEFRQLAERVQYKLLDETIVSINNAMNIIFRKVFDDDIHVELQLFREIKSKKRQTPHVNCIIHYKGAKYTNINLISGGERNRLNLGMILALNLVSSSPLIILDECTNFLNNRLRSRCISAARKLVEGHKTVLAVCHEDNDANYDHIIPVVAHPILDFAYPLVDGS